jgi:hypothetical protein
MLKISNLNAQGSRLIIVALQVGAVMEALRQKERRGETEFTHLNADVYFYFYFFILFF